MEVRRVALHIARFGERKSTLAQFLDQCVAILDVADLREGNGPPDADLEDRADPARGLPKHQRQAKREAQVARELKEAAVLADEEHRNHGGARHTDELAGE